jgi:hypothetical protein
MYQKGGVKSSNIPRRGRLRRNFVLHRGVGPNLGKGSYAGSNCFVDTPEGGGMGWEADSHQRTGTTAGCCIDSRTDNETGVDNRRTDIDTNSHIVCRDKTHKTVPGFGRTGAPDNATVAAAAESRLGTAESRWGAAVGNRRVPGSNPGNRPLLRPGRGWWLGRSYYCRQDNTGTTDC